MVTQHVRAVDIKKVGGKFCIGSGVVCIITEQQPGIRRLNTVSGQIAQVTGQTFVLISNITTTAVAESNHPDFASSIGSRQSGKELTGLG